MELPAVDITSYLSLLYKVDPAILQGSLLVFGFFFIALLIGMSRRFLISSSLQGVWAGIVTGMVLLLGVEAGIAWGMRSIASGENAEILPANVRQLLTRSQKNVTQVLGIQTEREQPNAQSIISDFQILSPLDVTLVQSFICQPQEKTESTGSND